jgi:hypothetical protein
MPMSGQSIRKAKRPKAVTTLETNLTIIDFKAGKRAVIINLDVELRYCKEVLTEMKKHRMQPTIDLFQED